jgi:hypothetical protein
VIESAGTDVMAPRSANTMSGDILDDTSGFVVLHVWGVRWRSTWSISQSKVCIPCLTAVESIWIPSITSSSTIQGHIRCKSRKLRSNRFGVSQCCVRPMERMTTRASLARPQQESPLAYPRRAAGTSLSDSCRQRPSELALSSLKA